MKRTIWVGFEPRETDAYLVAVQSILQHMSESIQIRPLLLSDLRSRGLYWREHEHHNGVMIDRISEAPMSTEFAISRFLPPRLAGHGLALFMDCDMLVRTDLVELFDNFDMSKALMCVQHKHKPIETVKMDGQVQLVYPRKNWSSVVMYNCDHPANDALTIELVNAAPGRDLHRFCWLDDDDIGALDPAWNYLVGWSSPQETEPKIVHFTSGIPSMYGYENSEYADEWREALTAALETVSLSAQRFARMRCIQ